MSAHTDVAIVGGGPAGMEAALAAADAGADVTLVDGYANIGGQIYRQLPAEFQPETPGPADGAELIHRFETANVRRLSGALVWGAFPAEDDSGDWLLALHGETMPHQLHARALVLATGAYDRPLAFPGWTLPGVMTTGAAQILLKQQRILPGKRILLSGAGPLQLAVAAALVEAGATVAAVLDSGRLPVARALRAPGTLLARRARLLDGWRTRRILRRAGVPLRSGWSVVAARGNESVSEAVIAPLDSAGAPIPGREETLAVDTILTGWGFIPATQLSRLLGCAHRFDHELGGWIPERDKHLQTTCSGVFAAGDGAGIGGAELARIEGRIAGAAAAHHAGLLSGAEMAGVAARENSARAGERRFARLLGAWFAPTPGLFTLPDDDTIICRCESVRQREIRAAVEAGAHSLAEVKGLTRCGMGNCQGRVCGQPAARLVARETGLRGSLPEQMAQVGALSVRPPIFPLPLSALAEAVES